MINQTNLGQCTYPKKKKTKTILDNVLISIKKKEGKKRKGTTFPSMCLAVRDKKKERKLTS